MLSYEAALQVPPPQSYLISDTISDRDAIIDNLLDRIHHKYENVAKENEAIKKALIERGLSLEEILENRDSIDKKKKDVQYIVSGVPVTNATVNQLCRPFENKNYDNGPLEHIKLYDELSSLISAPGYEKTIPGVHVDISNLADPSILPPVPIEHIEDRWYDRDSGLNRTKKYMANLNELATDFITDAVQVESVISRLDDIANDMNSDTVFIKKIFDGLLQQGEEGKINIIFKGGNVYKLFTQVLRNELANSIFKIYLTDVNDYFKKSDCDFCLVFTANKIGDINDYRFIELPRTEENEIKVNTVQYMILNKFRNAFLYSGNEYEYLTLCSKNDSFMQRQMISLGNSMLNSIVSSRFMFEQRLLAYLRKTVNFANDHKLDRYVGASVNLYSNSYGTKYESLLAIMSSDDDLNDCVNTASGLTFGVLNGKVVDWFRLYLSIALRSKEFIPTDPLFKHIRLPKDFIRSIQLDKDLSADWREVKTLYKVRYITNILFGDKSYALVTRDKHGPIDDNYIYSAINSRTSYPDATTEMTSLRFKDLGRLHSNRNDFYIRFSSKNHVEASGEIVSEDIMTSRTIPFSNDPVTGQDRRYITPFYISVNKEIKGRNGKFLSDVSIDTWLQHLRRFSVFGSNSTDIQDPVENPYASLYDRISNKLTDIKKNKETTIDFCLSRLMSSFTLIMYENTDTYLPLSVAGEFIDLSFSFSTDLKHEIYERANHYTHLTNVFSDNFVSDLENINASILSYLDPKSNNPNSYTGILRARGVPVTSAEAAALSRLECIRTGDFITLGSDADIVNFIVNNIGSLYTGTGPLAEYRPIPNDKQKVITYFKMYKFYSTYGSSSLPMLTVNYNTILFPKISNFILDIWSILYTESRYPWNDNKYAKRIQRLLFFMFIEKLQKTTLNNLPSVLKELGIMTDANMQDPKLSNRTKAHLRNKIIPGLKTQNPYVSSFIANYGDTHGETDVIYEEADSIQRIHRYFRMRDAKIYDSLIPQTMRVDPNDPSKGEIVVSACGIDHFMFTYHLLDFLDIYANADPNAPIPFVRCQFIVKRRMTETVGNVGQGNSLVLTQYVLVTLTDTEAGDTNTTLDIIRRTPTHIDYYHPVNNIEQTDLPNPDVILSDGTTIKRYTLISEETSSVFKKMAGYIKTVEAVRERLIITLSNYVNDTNSSAYGIKSIIHEDPLKILLNLYEGDINKVLSMV